LGGAPSGAGFLAGVLTEVLDELAGAVCDEEFPLAWAWTTRDAAKKISMNGGTTANLRRNCKTVTISIASPKKILLRTLGKRKLSLTRASYPRNQRCRRLADVAQPMFVRVQGTAASCLIRYWAGWIGGWRVFAPMLLSPCSVTGTIAAQNDQ